MARRRAKKPPPPTVVTLENAFGRAEILVRAGGTIGSLRLGGRDLLAAPPVADVEREYVFRASLDIFPANLYLKAGFAIPLFPVVGHLPARPLGLDLGEADVLGRRVPVPLNSNREHWYGLAYGARTEIIAAESERLHLRLPAGFFGPYWTGLVDLDLIYTLGETFRAEMKATNIGPAPVPVQMGVRLALRGEVPYERTADGVKRGSTSVQAAGIVEVGDAVTLSASEGFVTLEPDAHLKFTWEISGSTSPA